MIPLLLHHVKRIENVAEKKKNVPEANCQILLMQFCLENC